MADDDSGVTARLAVSLEARLTRFEAALKRAEALANGSMGVIENRAKQAEQRLANSLAQINLEHQLDVARAKGNSKVVEELSQELALRQKITQLTRAGLSADEARAVAEKQMTSILAARKSNEGLSGAAKSIAGSTRLATLEEGGARLGIYAGALEKLGPAGFAAAAGLAAAGVGFEEAHKAMEWAEDTEKAAKALGLTTTQLQQLDFAAIKAGIGAETLHEGLQKVSQTVGAFTSNVRDARVNPIFDALNKAAGGGFTKADVGQWQGPMDALEHIADGIAKIKDRSQQLTLLKDLKVPDEMVPLLLQGGDAIRTAAKEAKDLGVVMDEGTVKKAAELNEKVKEASAIIGNQLRTAFVNLAPAVLVIVNMMAKMATFAADTADNFKHPLTYTPEDMSDHHLQENIAEAKRIMAENEAGKDRWEKVPLSQKGIIQGGIDKIQADTFYRAKKQLDLSTPEAARREKEDKDAVLPPATAIVADKAPKEKKAKQDRDDTGLVTGADDTLDEAKRGLAQAIAKQSTDLQDKADAEKAENFATLQKQTDDLVRKEMEIDKAIGATKDKKKQAALRAAEGTLEEAAVADGLARAAKDELVERQKLVGLIEQAAAAAAQDAQMRQDGFRREEDYYRAVAGLASTTDERRSFERKALEAAQARERDEAQTRVDAAMSAYGKASAADDKQGMLSAIKSVSSAVTAQAALPAQQGLQNQAFDNSHLSPWAAWVKEGNDSAADVGNNVQAYAVKSMNNFNDSIAKSIVDGKNMGQVFSGIFKQMETDLINYLLKQAEIGAFGGGPANAGGGSGVLAAIGSIFGSPIPKFAGGTDDAPGGVADVGEHGPERIVLPKGSKVVPNNVLSGLNTSATRAMNISPTTVIHGPEFKLMNPVVTQDLLDQAYAFASDRAARAAFAGAQGGHQMTMDRLAQNRRYGLR